jgi:putative solute:sodium symporter small subunit
MMRDSSQRQGYWRANTALIGTLLLVWAGVSLGLSILLVEPLNHFSLGRLPLGFWMAQQGSIFVFVILIFVYAKQMDKLDRKFSNRDQEQP